MESNVQTLFCKIIIENKNISYATDRARNFLATKEIAKEKKELKPFLEHNPSLSAILWKIDWANHSSLGDVINEAPKGDLIISGFIKGSIFSHSDVICTGLFMKLANVVKDDSKAGFYDGCEAWYWYFYEGQMTQGNLLFIPEEASSFWKDNDSLIWSPSVLSKTREYSMLSEGGDEG